MAKVELDKKKAVLLALAVLAIILGANPELAVKVLEGSRLALDRLRRSLASKLGSRG